MAQRGRGNKLRAQAEERLEQSRTRELGHAAPGQLVYELELHQHELEIQNDELRAARSEVERGLERYTEMFDLAPIGHLALATDGLILNANLEAARMLAMSSRELIGKPFRRFVCPQHRGRYSVFLARLDPPRAGRRINQTCELSVEPAKGAAIEVRLVGSSVGGAEPGALVGMFDVTPIKRAEAALFEEARHKDEFLAALSHELRNPMAPIRNAVALLGHEQVSQRGRKALAIIDRQLNHLVRIVDDLLDVTRIAHGKIVLERKRINLAELLHRIEEDHRPTFERNGIALELRPPTEQIWVDADRTRLVEVVDNLLVNALKFTPRDGRVEISLIRHEAEAILSVCDNGVGIAPEVLKRLFQPFTAEIASS